MALQPDLQPNVDLVALTAISLLNPVVIGLGFYLGRKCDQPAKILIAGFGASFAGMALIWLAAMLRMPFIFEPGRAAGGIFVVQGLFGMVWAYIGYRWFRQP